MKIVQAYLHKNNWNYSIEKKEINNPLVLVFGERKTLQDQKVIDAINDEFPYKNIIFGSTAGEILGARVLENSVTVTALEFQKSDYLIKTANILDFNKDSKTLGENLIKQLPAKNLKHIFIISEGSYVNGSALIEGIEKHNSKLVKISGGLCGDNERFDKTLVSFQENPKEGEAVIIGLYGEELEITCASSGGWIPFGPERIITKSEGNILYEIDGVPALDIYKKYLGDKALDLPHSALLFPLNVKAKGKSYPVVRTILNINEEDKSMIFAGDVPVQSQVQLMMASIDAIVEGAGTAAKKALEDRKKAPEVALLISCIGRKLVMDQQTEEEIEEVLTTIGNQTPCTGFYSYGEIAPHLNEENCELHNQTMTLTLISE
ncbi:FIST signal transduction protein [Mesonia aestuariivivens]|uniref:FIST C-terminal domain-containing protein n=1 Tax=Mesonia aestuariivivens TaxID=2796128 RepID=A0ABS6W6Q3_9FLAO|nr:FIST N-terminal domain-containing protein [Mesonia aestuariivivens]MBW2962819.1 FIST C-terminal domain-containing protein [Mesonia aestuariivivens]